MTFFQLDLTRTEMEIIISMLMCQQELEEKEFTLRDISRIANLDYVSTIYREKEWLIKNRILILVEGNTFKVNFDNVAYLLFYSSNLHILYDFAFQYVAFGPPKKLE